MRRLMLLVSAVVLMGCSLLGGAVPGIPPGTVSCQPWGYTPAPVPLSYPTGPVTAATAEQTSAAMIRRCMVDAGTITDLAIASEPKTGVPSGPNAGQAVWWVQVDVTVAGVGYQSHFVIEVNRATGVPVMIGYG